MPTPDFAAAVRRRQRELVVELSGELDAATGPARSAAIAALEHDGATTVVIDLGRMSFVDAKGVCALLEAHRRLRERGMTVRVANPQPLVLRVLRITGVDSVLLDDTAHAEWN